MASEPTHDEVFGPDPIEAAMDSAGLTISALVMELAGKMAAKSEKVFYDRKTGKVVYSAELDALDIQLKALDMALKLRGAYPAEKHEHTGKNGGPMEFKGEMNIGALRNAIKRSRKTD